MYPQARKTVVNLSNLCGYSTISNVIHPSSPHMKGTQLKSFEEIPGPKSLPLIGTLYKYLPLIGEYSFKYLDKSGLKKYKKYGPLVKEEIVKGVPIIWVYDPEDIAKIFQIDSSRHPQRRSHLALYKYRKDRSDVYNSGGLLPTNGSEWWRLRKEFQKDLSKPQNISNYLPSVDEMIRNFAEFVKTKKDCPDLLPFLSRLFLELTCLVAFDKKLNCFSENEMQKDSVSSKLIKAAFVTNSAILKLDNGPQLWQYIDTPLYRKVIKAQNFMEKVAIDLVSQKKREIAFNKSSNNSLLENYLQNPALDEKDIIGMSCDMLLAGVDTTSYSVAFVLYHIANNPKCQEKLYEESKKLLINKNDAITVDILKEASYTKAVLKESLRLNPLSVGIGRILQTDVILSGYCVPKGVVAVTQNQIVCRLEKYFKNANKFVPERWLRDNENKTKTHPFLIIPFGHGPRSCIARRFAEQNMQTILLRICRNFHLTWKGGLLGTKSLLINVPDSPVKIHFEERDR